MSKKLTPEPCDLDISEQAMPAPKKLVLSARFKELALSIKKRVVDTVRPNRRRDKYRRK